MEIPNLLLYATPVFLLAIIAEYWISKKLNLRVYEKSDFLANIGIGLGGALFGGFASLYGLAIYYLVYTTFTPIRIQLLGVASLGWVWYVWVLAVLAEDFTFYWFHRLSHRVRLFWAFHIVHHSSTYFNYSTAIRNGWFSILFKPIFWVWMAAVGFHPLIILACLSNNAVFQFFCHTRIGFSWNALSGCLSTPRLHAIHHGISQEHIDKNFAGIFIFYDRLFDTYAPFDKDQQILFGVTKPPESHNIFEITFHELKNMWCEIRQEPNWRYKIANLLRPPDWKQP